MDVLPKRFGKYGLTVHPDKTRLVPFRRPPHKPPTGGDVAGPDSFDLLGFTHFWARSRKGNWVVKRKTSSSRRAPTAGWSAGGQEDHRVVKEEPPLTC